MQTETQREAIVDSLCSLGFSKLQAERIYDRNLEKNNIAVLRDYIAIKTYRYDFDKTTPLRDI